MRLSADFGNLAGLGEGLKQGLLLGAAVLVLVIPSRPPRLPAPVQPQEQMRTQAPVPAAPGLAETPRVLDLAGEADISPEAEQVARWVVAAADNGRRPFAIIDKKNARVLVFAAHGRLIGATPVLLGYAAGDDSVAGIGKRPIADVRPEERTTPAGRFLAEPGRNALNEDVIWVDYEAAVSMHRVRLTNPAERRAERLASKDARQRRISYGCVNMPPAFFEDVLWPAFRRQGGYVYVLPEIKPLPEVFPALSDMRPT